MSVCVFRPVSEGHGNAERGHSVLLQPGQERRGGLSRSANAVQVAGGRLEGHGASAKAGIARHASSAGKINLNLKHVGGKGGSLKC